ncbi:MAG: hypothetical protein QM796_20625 [Chthoniobacteraceae bacterium]
MKDRQSPYSGTQPGVPILSPILHCLAMPVIVYLRRDFGFAYLSPKSVFFALIWLALLFFIYICYEPSVWPRYGFLGVFAFVASLLYLFHLITAFSRELKQQGKHDYFSGTSYFARLPFVKSELTAHLWAEPAVTCFIAILAGQRWLLWTGVGLWLKEFINYWYVLRRQKKGGDALEDVADNLDHQRRDVPPPATPSISGRTDRRARKRIDTDPEEEIERSHAERLKLIAPYTLDEAETNFRKLIMGAHPDHNPSPESSEQADELMQAVEYFRKKLADGR